MLLALIFGITKSMCQTKMVHSTVEDSQRQVAEMGNQEFCTRSWLYDKGVIAWAETKSMTLTCSMRGSIAKNI